MPEIEIVIDPQGNPTVTVKGVAGASCFELAKGIEEAMGQVKSSRVTEEFYETAEVAKLHQEA